MSIDNWPTLTTVTDAHVMTMGMNGTAMFTWDAREPYVVNMELVLPLLDAITFQFARELLDRAFSIPGKPAGMGDVIVEEIEPHHLPFMGMSRLASMRMPMIRFLLARDNGNHVAVFVPQPPVVDFVIRSFMVVPAGREDVGVDTAIEKILGSAS